MTAQTDDGRLASIEADVRHILAQVGEMRQELLSHAEKYRMEGSCNLIHDSFRAEINSMIQTHRDEINGFGRRVEALEKRLEKKQDTNAARAWQIAAGLIVAACIALAGFFIGDGGRLTIQPDSGKIRNK